MQISTFSHSCSHSRDSQKPEFFHRDSSLFLWIRFTHWILHGLHCSDKVFIARHLFNVEIIYPPQLSTHHMEMEINKHDKRNEFFELDIYLRVFLGNENAIKAKGTASHSKNKLLSMDIRIRKTSNLYSFWKIMNHKCSAYMYSLDSCAEGAIHSCTSHFCYRMLSVSLTSVVQMESSCSSKADHVSLERRDSLSFKSSNHIVYSQNKQNKSTKCNQFNCIRITIIQTIKKTSEWIHTWTKTKQKKNSFSFWCSFSNAPKN